MPTWEEDIVSNLTNLGGTGTYAEIYDEVKSLRVDLPTSWKDVIRRQIQDRSSDSAGFMGVADLFFSVEGLGRGVWGLRQFVQPTPIAADLPGGNGIPGRTRQTTYRVLQDTVQARQIKLLHRDARQLYGEALRISPTKTYSEAHHIIPLRGDFAGPDTASNVIVPCPNRHALCVGY
ncbi:HNH endonuclease [Micromonospora sp. WP24]|uniref:HNH endonuclease signature motif containing protein n=1 Tax=Micromonospora sp. WP24 TaxID=2604469 RepID=UPI0011DB06A2|nr:HNH endonuclease [Micromonospora sp. WP24]TYB91844.1 HNH endonuclease [Micromonospora sp. WP24]